MNLDQAVREMLAPLFADYKQMFADCKQIRAELDRDENALAEIVDKRERAAARVELLMWRAKLNSVVSRIQDTEEHFMRLADERFPQWRT